MVMRVSMVPVVSTITMITWHRRRSIGAVFSTGRGESDARRLLWGWVGARDEHAWPAEELGGSPGVQIED